MLANQMPWGAWQVVKYCETQMLEDTISEV